METYINQTCAADYVLPYARWCTLVQLSGSHPQPLRRPVAHRHMLACIVATLVMPGFTCVMSSVTFDASSVTTRSGCEDAGLTIDPCVFTTEIQSQIGYR